jgi:hypothetical protein
MAQKENNRFRKVLHVIGEGDGEWEVGGGQKQLQGLPLQSKIQL